MGIKSMDADQFLAFLRKKQGDMTDKAFATQVLKVSPQYLCDVYNGRREPGESIASALGMTRQTRYVVNPSKEDE